ncbi:MAG: hypothetical protein MUE91_12940 [Ignavibacteriaceae bacterium]|jgi:hypothetical protein|nr:hypothetical protein [Ignavibacteriaceae bacterium]
MKNVKFDPEFNKLIRKAKPYWFSVPTMDNQSVGEHSKQISATYDPAFDKLIRKTKPEWFK